MQASRSGYARGTRPPRPGGLTGRLHHEDSKRADAAKRITSPVDTEAIRWEAWRAGFHAGHGAGWSNAIEFITETCDIFEKDDEDQGDEATQVAPSPIGGERA